EAGDPARPVDHVDELLPVRKVSDEHEVVVASREELEDTWIAADHDRASIGGPADVLDARDCLSCEETAPRFPVGLPGEGGPQTRAAVGPEPVALPAARTQHAR